MAYLLDSGYLYAQVNGKDSWHTSVSAVNLNENEPIFLPIPAITEVTFLLQRDLGRYAVWEFIDTLAQTDLLFESPHHGFSGSAYSNYNDANIDL